MQRRCDRNRKRSKRRAIYCPVHNCYMNSVSQKYGLFAERAGQLQQRGVKRREALMLVAAKTAVPLQGEWLEAFWCEECQQTKWYHIRKRDATYELSLAPAELWEQATGVIHPHKNPTVSEFTTRQSRMMDHRSILDFRFIS
ncbi:hypothetical protein H6G41_23550 [Tolypothrix sp. FACHB-123]|uniref:hypothetical protein n=1 Tax=Tolypothrix sp. FACHB-123 TaxID=2692868 RepID=UPI00168395B1|nr:hypothetical protein [Tolypothrix sp. FACHB-123]MBD2357552.1 hypothetical protein [Tolypothrix sp. FACHB-123]